MFLIRNTKKGINTAKTVRTRQPIKNNIITLVLNELISNSNII